MAGEPSPPAGAPGTSTAPGPSSPPATPVTPSTPEATAASAQSRPQHAVEPGVPASAPPRRHRRPRLGNARLGEHFVIGPRMAQVAICRGYERKVGDPLYRPLRIYALEPSASIGDGALAVVNVPYEPLCCEHGRLRGALLEILDEPAPGHGFLPDAEAAPEAGTQPSLDLDDPFLLMQQGLPPSPEDPRFRQQMAYAVASTTYAAFQEALGRDVAWGFRRHGDDSRLRIRPAIEDLRNAFYDRTRGEVRFGSFAAGSAVTGRNVPNGRISLALSHDVVVHEMSHALLDGLRSHFLYPSNLDVLAFHEGFADLVAIFQRFTYREVVSSAIRISRGDVTGARLLTDVALQFAQAMNATGALRSAVASVRRYEETSEPHQRGEILVAAVFDAYARVYQKKTAPLIRLATDGTAVLAPGEIPEGLVRQLTDRACSLASQFLSICIRAIDYCPPVDVTFGEFLRAVVTADADLVPHDDWAYREAWIDAFASRHIYPAEVPSLSEGALMWRAPEEALPVEPELSFAQLRFEGDPGHPAGVEEMRRQARAFGQLAADPVLRHEFGLASAGDAELDGDEVSLPVVESVRSSRRVGPSGQVVFDLIAEITQRRVVRARPESPGLPAEPGFDFFGGATVILGPQGNVRYVVRKSVLDRARLRRQRAFMQVEGAQFFGSGPENSLLPEPKLLLTLHDVTRPQLRAGVGTRALEKGSDDKAAREAGQRYLLRVDDSAPQIVLLKACLRQCLEPAPVLDGEPVFDLHTERAVSRLQSVSGAAVDGMVGPQTWTITGRRLKHRLDGLPLAGMPAWIVNLLVNEPANADLASLDIARALDLYEFSFGTLSPPQRDGLAGLLASVAADDDITDLRWAAYMLATVKHECADTWQPIEELGRGKARGYGDPEPLAGPDGQVVRNVYYGRGYVQLTWLRNYLEVGHALGLGSDLALHPDLALQPGTAYAVMSYGMRNGTFTGRKLGDYIGAAGTDYEGARRIINGTDRAALIAGYAAKLESVLLASCPAMPG